LQGIAIILTIPCNFRQHILPVSPLESGYIELFRADYVTKTLPATDEFRQLIIKLTGGLPRLIIALWIAAHRVAFERLDDDLRLEDFQKAARSYMAPLGPAIEALVSNDPKRMARYEDLMPRDDGYWTVFWNSLQGL
jgi:hypothetical protein